MQLVEHHGQKIAVKLSREDFRAGLSFFTDPTDFIQVGSWRYAAGKELPAHNHQWVQRSSDRTQEVVAVLQGRLRVRLYGEDDVFREALEAERGEVVILFSGGHGYDILEEDTIVLEVKNGPYPGAEADRRRLAAE